MNNFVFFSLKYVQHGSKRKLKGIFGSALDPTKEKEYQEKITLKKLKLDSVVISLGGGAFTNKLIRKEVLRSSISFWLNWNTTILLKRIRYSKKRPLAFNATDNQLVDLIKKRNNIYSKALYEIKCDNLSKKQVIDKVLKIYETH